MNKKSMERVFLYLVVEQKIDSPYILSSENPVTYDYLSRNLLWCRFCWVVFYYYYPSSHNSHTQKITLRNNLNF